VTLAGCDRLRRVLPFSGECGMSGAGAGEPPHRSRAEYGGDRQRVEAAAVAGGGGAFRFFASSYDGLRPEPERARRCLVQTSLYRGLEAKLACEAQIQAYSEYFRTAVVHLPVLWLDGRRRYTHGVVFDFCQKLDGLTRLEVLETANSESRILMSATASLRYFTAMRRSPDERTCSTSKPHY
jgi:hypothetical protein